MGDLFSPTILIWTFTQATFFQFWTPDLLRVWGVGTPNGSLWTIPVEIQFYILLPIIVLTFKNVKLINKFIFFIVISILFNTSISDLRGEQEVLAIKLAQVSLLPYLYCFLTGSILFLYWNKIKYMIEGKAVFWLIIFALFIWITGISPSYFPNIIEIIANFILSILTISLAFTLPNLSKFLNGNDISYGMYIYHMLIVNSFISLGFIGDLKYLFVVIFITIVLSWLSWIFVEKRSLLLKNHIK